MSTPVSPTSSLVTRLFAAGAHFGFKKSRRHPTVVPYLFGTKDGNDVFDLEKSVVTIETAAQVLRDAGSQGKTVLFVGTKSEITRLVLASAERVNMPYVINRWIGGMLTNFPEIKKRIARLETLRNEQESGELDRKYTKKERVVLGREMAKLNTNFGGIVHMNTRPAVMVVVDPRHDSIAVAEARELKIPVIAIASSDCDVSRITYPVVLNDSLQSSVTLVLNELVTALQTGMQSHIAPVAAPREVRRTVGTTN